MSDIFREVDEDLRREQYKRLWDRFGTYVIALAVLIVVAVGGYKAWEWWENTRAAATGDRFLAALTLSEEGKHEEAVAALDAVAADGSGGYPVLAIFRSAGEKAAAGDTDGAVAAYDSIATRSGLPPLVADLARIRAALILVDSQSPEELSSRIGDMAQTGNPWRQAAREILGLSAYRSNDLASARKYFDQIVADQESAQGVRQRAQLMLTLIQSREGPPPPAEPEEG
jgi:hypothetical protein